MRRIVRRRLLAIAAVVVVIATSLALGEGDEGYGAPSNFTGGYSHFEVTMPEGALLAASSAVGSPAYHRHRVRSGSVTTYMLRVLNTGKKTAKVHLSVENVTDEWSANLKKSVVDLHPGAKEYVMIELRPGSNLPAGNVGAVKVRAKVSSGKSEEITLEAETTDKHKIYFISLDSLGQQYLKLNAKGTGWGKEGDWLMPNLRALLKESTFYPNHLVHLISATDMNHAVYLSGVYPGRLGIYSVQVFLKGFDGKGRPLLTSTPLDLMYWGPDGKPVTNIFNVVKDPAYGGDSNAFTAYSSGKGWVPEHYRNPVMGLDRIATTEDYPDYVTPSNHIHSQKDLVRAVLRMKFSKLPPNLVDWEDVYTINQTIEVVKNEDPDVFYILFGAPDSAGHIYGVAYDFDEWDGKDTPEDLTDDISRINENANRDAILKTIRNADTQVGRFIEFLKKRGTFEDSIIIVESDHNMETNSFETPHLQKILKKTGYSEKKDYYMLTLSQIGLVFLRKNDPKIVPALEKALENYRMKNPVTGREECPMIVLTRDEMRTGIDNATGMQATVPGGLYSEYYIEHPGPKEIKYPDMFLLSKKYYQLPVIGVGLANIGMAFLPVDLPPMAFFIGGHGGPSTQPSLLMIRGPGIPRGIAPTNRTYASDVAPTLYRLEGYKIPECVQGKGLPKIDPTMQ